MPTPLSHILTHDLDQTLASLRSAAKRLAVDPPYLPQDLMITAVAFTIQLAIEGGHAPDPLRTLESELINHIRAAKQDPLGSLTTESEDRNQIIDIRDALLAKGDTLSVPDQNLFRDCNIALGLVRCKSETREEARIRVLRAIHSPTPNKTS